MGLIVITAYLRPPEKWSLFSRKRSHDMVIKGGILQMSFPQTTMCERVVFFAIF